MKVGVIGHFMFEGDQCNGQAIKTLNYYKELQKHYKNTDSSFHILSIIVSSSPKTFIRVKNIVISTDNVVNTTPS